MSNSIGTAETELSFSMLLEYASDNDVEGFKRLVCDESEIMEVGLWYGHQRILEHRTPLMIAAKYGSLDVVNLILALPEVDVNFSCGPDKRTALHCAVSGGSVNAIDVVKLLLLAGADPSIPDANGHLPVDVIVAPPSFPYMKIALEELLKNNGSLCQWDLLVSTGTLRSSSPPISVSSEESSLFSVLGSISSPVTCKPDAKKEYPVDPSFPDIKNDIYTTDEFRMFSFKIQPCSRAYSHDWTECPFVHPGENACRRDPRRFQYSCVPCPDHRKGACRRGDLCEYSHGIFECWLHPHQYRTRLCKDSTGCKRKVCFFAHVPEELRRLYQSTDAAMSSPQSAAMDITAASNLLSGSSMSHFQFTPPTTPSGKEMCSPMSWYQQNNLTLQISGNNRQGSRLRTSLGAREFPSEELNRFQDFESQQFQFMNELYSVNLSAHLSPFNSSNADTDQLGGPSVYSPSYKSAVLNQIQQQGMLSPVKTGFLSSNVVNYPLVEVSFHSSPLMRMSPRIHEPISPYNHGINSWSVEVDELDQLHKSCLNRHCGEEPDVSWIQSVLKESPSHLEQTLEGGSGDPVALRAWLEGLQLDQIVA